MSISSSPTNPSIARTARRAMCNAHPSIRGSVDDVSGTDTDGRIMTDNDVMNRVRADGSVTLVRGPAERLRRSGWPDDFIAFAEMRGMAVSIRDDGRIVFVVDVNWAGWTPPDDDYTDTPSARAAHPSRGRGLRTVRKGREG